MKRCLCVFAGLGVLARSLTVTLLRAQHMVSREDAEIREDAWQAFKLESLDPLSEKSLVDPFLSEQALVIESAAAAFPSCDQIEDCSDADPQQ